MRLNGAGEGGLLFIGAIDAKKALEIRLGGDYDNLKDLLDGAGVLRDAFIENLPTADAYSFVFRGQGYLRPVVGDITARSDGVGPCGE